MKKYIAAFGLAGLIGIGYWVAYRSGAETTTLPVKIEIVEKNGKTGSNSTPVSSYNSQSSSQPYSRGYEEYRNYVNSKIIVPSWLEGELFAPDVQQWCDEEEILRKHEEISQRIPHDDTGHDLFWDIKALIALDQRLANCKYKSVPQRYRELLLEMAEHFESIDGYKFAGQILYSLGEIEKAKELFLQAEGAVEFILKMTPLEELPTLSDYYLQQGVLFSAGKVEWFQGNRELGRTLIEQSKYYQETMNGAVRWYLAGKNYRRAAREMGELRLPFHHELAEQLCQGNEECLWEFKKYRLFE